MLGWLSRVFSANIAGKQDPIPFHWLDRQEALQQFLRNEKECHHVRLYLDGLEPRDLCDEKTMQGLEDFLAGAGNRLDVYVPPGELAGCGNHRFIELVQNHPGATLRAVPAEMVQQGDIMIGSHGHSYMVFQNMGGLFQQDDDETWAELNEWFKSVDGARPAVPAPA